MEKQKIIQLSDRNHCLIRPQMYIGNIGETESEEFIIRDKIQKEKIKYVPGLLKIINEILDNSVDEAVRTNFKFANRIKIEVNEKSILVEDNGRGIPVEKDKNSDEFMPVLAYCHARSGSNFSDDNRKTIGTNGLGAVLCNIFSKKFLVETSDGKNKLKLECYNNLSYKDFSIKKSSANFTKVYFEPDFPRFNLHEFNQIHQDLVYQRILFLSISFPKISFYFNGKKVAINSSKSFLSLFSDSFEILSGPSWFIGVFPNTEEDFSFISFVNGLNLKRGGTHVDLISNEISYKLRDLLSKKYKTIKPGDIKNKISLVVFFNDFPNMKFDSQTKETLTNSVKEIKQYLELGNEDFLNFSKKIIKNTEIIEPILEFFKLKEEYKKRKELKRISDNKNKRVVDDSYFPPVGDNNYLFLTEGFSASSSISRILGRQGLGYYSLKGKPLNSHSAKVQKIIANKELKTIIDILGLDLLDKNTDMNFKKVIFLSDQDTDGIHIRSLLLTFFYRFTPGLIEKGRIGFMNTPLIVAFGKKDLPVYWFFSLDEYHNFDQSKLKDLEIKYFKGLGSFNKNDLQSIIYKTGKMEDLFVSFQKEIDSSVYIDKWMSNEGVQGRKESLIGKSFNISSV
jgi:DNA gyrase/topoisomerase IV subunit B